MTEELKKENVNMLTDKNIEGLAYRYGLLRGFFNYVQGKNPEIIKAFFDREKENDALLAKFRGDCHKIKKVGCGSLKEKEEEGK